MTQPTYFPVSRSGEVRPTISTATPALGRPKKPGLLRHAPKAALTGTNAPGSDTAAVVTTGTVASGVTEVASNGTGGPAPPADWSLMPKVCSWRCAGWMDGASIGGDGAGRPVLTPACRSFPRSLRCHRTPSWW